MKFRDAKAGAAIMGLVGTLDKPYDLLGRKTYDIFASYWPHVAADNPIGPVFTKANKYVLTRGSAKLNWANSHKMRNIDDLRKVKAGDGPDIVLWGSSTLYPQLSAGAAKPYENGSERRHNPRWRGAARLIQQWSSRGRAAV